VLGKTETATVLGKTETATVPVPSAPIAIPVAVKAVKAVATVTTVTAFPAKRAASAVDPLRIAMEFRDPMYSLAGTTQRTAMECEEAQRIEVELPSLYKSQGGRSRGWTLSGLDPMMKPRCATGLNPQALRAAKATFDWNLNEKGSSAFLDFICIAKQIRVAVWALSTKTVTLYPAADRQTVEPTSPPLYHVEEGGFLSRESLDGPALIKYADANGWTLAPPASVLKSLAHLTLPELESVGKQLGAPEFTDLKKAERIAALGAFKVKQRLSTSPPS